MILHRLYIKSNEHCVETDTQAFADSNFLGELHD